MGGLLDCCLAAPPEPGPDGLNANLQDVGLEPVSDDMDDTAPPAPGPDGLTANLQDVGLEPVSDDMDNKAAAILLQGDLRLVSGIWLLAQDPKVYRVQRLQDLPQDALVPPRDAAAMMLEPQFGLRFGGKAPPRVLAVSYRWLTKAHPDPHGIQLHQVRAFLEAMTEAVFRSRRDASTRALLDIGILWDFMSLPQHPRLASEHDVFVRGLKAINCLYGSRTRTITLQCLRDPDGFHPYRKSGWCRFEEAVSGIGKAPSRLLAVVGELPMLSKPSPKQSMKPLGPHPGQAVLESQGLGNIAFRLHREFAKLSACHDFTQLCSRMSISRLPPVHPDEMARLLRSDEVAFTNQSDAEMVIQKYRDFFGNVADTVCELRYRHCDLPCPRDRQRRFAKVTWSSDQFRLLGQALGDGGLRNCKYLSLSGINLSRSGAQALADALGGEVSLEEVQLPTEIEKQVGMGTLFEGYDIVDQSVDPAAISLLAGKLAQLSIRVSYAESPF